MKENIQLRIEQVTSVYHNKKDFIKVSPTTSIKFVKEDEGKLFHSSDGFHRENTLTVLRKEDNKKYTIFVQENGDDEDDLQVTFVGGFTIK